MSSEIQQKLTDRTCKYLRSTLLSQKGGVVADQLARDYMDLVGEEIPFGRLNFSSLESFLRSVPDVCQLNRSGTELIVVGVASRDTKHIEEMVARQNSKGGKKKGGGGNRRSGVQCQSFSNNDQSSMVRKSRGGDGRQQGWGNVPSRNRGWEVDSCGYYGYGGGSVRRSVWVGGQGHQNGGGGTRSSQNSWGDIKAAQKKRGGAMTNGWDGAKSYHNGWAAGGVAATRNILYKGTISQNDVSRVTVDQTCGGRFSGSQNYEGRKVPASKNHEDRGIANPNVGGGVAATQNGGGGRLNQNDWGRFALSPNDWGRGGTEVVKNVQWGDASRMNKSGGTRNDRRTSIPPRPMFKNALEGDIPTPPKYLGQGWQSTPLQQSRNKEHPMFPSSVAARGPRIRLAL